MNVYCARARLARHTRVVDVVEEHATVHLLTRLSNPSSLTPTPAITAALGRTCCCLCLLTPSVVVTPPHRRVPRASLTDAPPVPPHQVQRFCVTLPFCVCFVRPSAQGRLLLRVLRAFRLLRCVKLFYQLATHFGYSVGNVCPRSRQRWRSSWDMSGALLSGALLFSSARWQ